MYWSKIKRRCRKRLQKWKEIKDSNKLLYIVVSDSVHRLRDRPRGLYPASFTES